MTLEGNLISFRRLAEDDLLLMHGWLNTEHVSRWYDANGGRRPSYEDVMEKYAARIHGKAKTEPFLIMLGDRPVGYIQCYRIRDHPQYAEAVDVEDGACGIDLFIGEEDSVYRGPGPHILSRFLHDVVFRSPDAPSCVIGPAITNVAAIRAYEMTGFIYLKTVQVPGEPEPEYLMRIAPEDVIDISSDSQPRL